MKKLFKRFPYLLIGIFSGLVIGSGWFAWAAIQSQVGINQLNSGNAWAPSKDATNFPQGATGSNSAGVFATGVMVQGGTFGSWNPWRAPDVGTVATNAPGIGSVAHYLLSSTDTFLRAVGYDRDNDSFPSQVTGVGLYSVDTGTSNVRRMNNAFGEGDANDGRHFYPISGMLFNGATFDRIRGSNSASNTSGTGLLASAPLLWDGSLWRAARVASTTTLTEATSLGGQLTIPLSTWSVTHTPGAAVQATASKALGGGTVRHVATTITACSAQAGTAQTPIAINLRDGATGAGTVLRTWLISSVIQDSKCVEASGLAMIGTANTAMTLEFAAAGVAGSEQTVTLTGFSVP